MGSSVGKGGVHRRRWRSTEWNREALIQDKECWWVLRSTCQGRDACLLLGQCQKRGYGTPDEIMECQCSEDSTDGDWEVTFPAEEHRYGRERNAGWPTDTPVGIKDHKIRWKRAKKSQGGVWSRLWMLGAEMWNTEYLLQWRSSKEQELAVKWQGAEQC